MHLNHIIFVIEQRMLILLRKAALCSPTSSERTTWEERVKTVSVRRASYRAHTDRESDAACFGRRRPMMMMMLRRIRWCVRSSIRACDCCSCAAEDETVPQVGGGGAARCVRRRDTRAGTVSTCVEIESKHGASIGRGGETTKRRKTKQRAVLQPHLSSRNRATTHEQKGRSSKLWSYVCVLAGSNVISVL